MTPATRTKARHRRTAAYFLYLGVVVFLFLAAWTAREVLDAWQDAQARSRAEAIFELVQVSTPKRPTATPGSVAWLDLALRRYGTERLRASDDPGAGEDLVTSTAEPGPIPSVFARVLEGIRAAPPGNADMIRTSRDEAHDNADSTALQFRTRRFLSYGDDELVLTRRRSLDTEPNDLTHPSNRFLLHVVPRLSAVYRHLSRTLEDEPLTPIASRRTPRVVRVYALSSDGSFVSLPFPADPADPESRRLAIREEGHVFRKRPNLPSFVSNEFFFDFDFTRPEGQSAYSGLYLDLGGHGLVSTLMVPIADPQDSDVRGVLAVDITFRVEWRDFARRIEEPLVAHVVRLESRPSPGGWRPWHEIRRALNAQKDSGEDIDPALDDVLADLARSRSSVVGSEPTHHDVVEGKGAVAIFQVSASEWLVVLFPESATRLPILAASLLLALALILLAGFELNRRRAEHSRLRAENELRERQNLLDTMQVPLTVVDPNTDLVVYGNAAASNLGIEPGSCIGDLVANDPRARAHYDKMQLAGGGRRRAYGVPLRLRDTDRHVVIRSVAVTAPIESLDADERHRLGILFLLEPEDDLAFFSEDLESHVRNDERRRLAGLLSHGVDTLSRVLDRRLRDAGADDPFASWLAGYLARRIAITAWLLDHWHDEPPLPAETTVEASQVRVSLERFQRVFALTRADAELRSRLHWSNGVLSDGEGDAFDVAIEWPEGYLFTCPVKGGAGLFLEEVLVNAVKHGRPGSRPSVEVDLDPVRRELAFEVRNEERRDAERSEDDVKPYGGRRLLERLARLFGWRDLSFVRRDGGFVVSWRVPVSERASPGESE